MAAPHREQGVGRNRAGRDCCCCGSNGAFIIMLVWQFLGWPDHTGQATKGRRPLSPLREPGA